MLLVCLELAVLEPELGEIGTFLTPELRGYSLSQNYGHALGVLRLYSKVAIFQPELRECFSRAACVIETCDFSRGCENAFRVLLQYSRGTVFKPEMPRTRGQSSPRPRACESSHETTSKAISRAARVRKFAAALKTNSYGATARTIRQAQSLKGARFNGHRRAYPPPEKAERTQHREEKVEKEKLANDLG